jgi:anti-anti-sigma factor
MSLETETLEDSSKGKRIISLIGSLDTDTAPQLEAQIDETVDDNVNILIMDMHRLEFISSAGLRVIFKTKKFVESHDGKFMLLNLQPQVRKVFEIIKALDGMNVFTSEQEMDEYLAAMQQQVLDEQG